MKLKLIHNYGYNLTYQNLTIIGINSTTIAAKDRGGLQFSGNGTMNMKGIVWYKCGSDDYSCLNFNSLYTVEIENCTFINSTGINLTSTSYVLINKCAFHNNTFTLFNAAVLLESDQYSSLSISNSIFQTNQGPLMFILSTLNYVVVCNCSFKNNIDIEFDTDLGVLLEFGCGVQNCISTKLSITWCNFTNNSALIIIASAFNTSIISHNKFCRTIFHQQFILMTLRLLC